MTHAVEDAEARGATDAPQMYRTDADAVMAGFAWPASWHRALCGRAADGVPGLQVSYWAGCPPERTNRPHPPQRVGPSWACSGQGTIAHTEASGGPHVPP